MKGWNLMNTLLMIIIALKAVCLVICWKGIKMARQQRKLGNHHSKEDLDNVSHHGSQEEVQTLQTRMSELMEQNEKLRKEMHLMKDSTREIN